jgi:acyl-CoA thioester hydrolase
MTPPSTDVQFRVRYSDTDQMRTYYNARVLEWFEIGRSELLRTLGRTYREMEALGILLPVSEAHVEYQGRAQYDDLLCMNTTMTRAGRARLRFDMVITHADGRPVCRGWTVHVIADAAGKPMRPPEWLARMADGEGHATPQAAEGRSNQSPTTDH